jgi:hypothetical protein
MEKFGMEEATPLVSVIIRSLGRDSLARSIASVHAQTYRRLEIVVVDAGASGIAAPRESTRIACQVVGRGPYDRPSAANAGLAAANGEWLSFLDDDDAYMPAHIESLLAAARASDGALVAYSATQCLDPRGRPVGTIGAGFDRLKLHSKNYIQIGAALFNRSLVLDGCRFDEEFLCLQDWDFWLQLSQRTHFAYTGEATNLWNAFIGASGCGLGTNADTPLQDRFAALLARKWKATGDALRRKVGHHNRLACTAMQRGFPEKADAHMVIAERLMRGPVRSPSRRATRRAAGGAYQRSTTMAGS